MKNKVNFYSATVITFVLSVLLFIVLLWQLSNVPQYERTNNKIPLNEHVIIYGFTAEWCGSCDLFFKEQQKIFNKEIEIFDVDKHPKIVERAMTYGVREVPAILILKNDSVVTKYYARRE